MKDFFDTIEEKICVVTISIMLALAFANVISRYFIHSSISFTEEITTGLFVLLCTMGAAVAAKRGAHLGLSLISNILPDKPQAVLEGITNIS